MRVQIAFDVADFDQLGQFVLLRGLPFAFVFAQFGRNESAIEYSIQLVFSGEIV